MVDSGSNGKWRFFFFRILPKRFVKLWTKKKGGGGGVNEEKREREGVPVLFSDKLFVGQIDPNWRSRS